MEARMAAPAIQITNLTKVYKGNVRALDNLTLDVQPGEIFGYLGPNGAGKTTTIRLLLDLIRPTEGSATILGLDAQADSVELHKRIGFLPGELNLWKNLTGQQVVNFVGRVRGELDDVYVRQLADRLQLDLRLTVRSYSTGNRRKLGIVLAWMNKPDLLILDEPTGGLDPLMQQSFNDMVREVKREGRTIFLSSHVLSEVQAICDRVGILRNGQLKAVERISDLTHAEFSWVTLHVREVGQLESQLAQLAGVSEVSVEDSTVKLRLSGDFDPLLRALNDAYVIDIRVQDPSLEEIFLAYYGNNRETTS
jgi:ABC-2 type transport system ATP-binding protein